MCVSGGYLPEREIPEFFLAIIYTILTEFGPERFDKRMRIDMAIDELCQHLEKSGEKHTCKFSIECVLRETCQFEALRQHDITISTY